MWKFEPRAVVPPADLLESRDVTVPTPTHVKSSPYPFGLGVYNSPRHGKKKGLPLVYVPPLAAAYRSAIYTMKPGWYVIARPGTTIELRTTLVNDRGITHGEHLTTCIYVDGESTNQPHSFRNPAYSEFVTTGITDVGESTRGSGGQRRIRKFTFQRAEPQAKEGRSDRSIECVQLDVYKASGEMSVAFPATTRTYNGMAETIAKDTFANREGQSQNTGRRKQSVSGRNLPHSHSSPAMTKIPEATVTILVKEASWMRSRRLIDDEGRPCTHEMFLGLVQKDSHQAIPSPFSSRMVLDEGSARKKAKLQADPQWNSAQDDDRVTKP